MSSREAPAPHAAVVYNPVQAPRENIRHAFEKQEEQHGWSRTRWYATGREDSGRRAAQTALEGRPAVLIVAGGDGTARTVAEVVQHWETPIALLPFGTGNLLARNLGLPLDDIDACVRAAFLRTVRKVDVAVAELEDDEGNRSCHRFLVMAGIGLDAEMATNTKTIVKRHLGWLAYVAPITRSIIANRLFTLRYQVDGRPERSARAHTVIVGNCGTLTGNMLLLPEAVVDDGFLNVVMFQPKDRLGWAKIGLRLVVQGIAHQSRIGRHVIGMMPAHKALTYAEGRRFDVRFEVPHSVELDGDSFGRAVSARITVRPGALAVCVPAEGH